MISDFQSILIQNCASQQVTKITQGHTHNHIFAHEACNIKWLLDFK